MDFAVKNSQPLVIFAVGVLCAILGIIMAWAIFPVNIGIVSVFFTTLALLPFLGKMFPLSKIMIGSKRPPRKSLRSRILFYLDMDVLVREYREIVKIYVILFLGIFLVYIGFQAMLPHEIAKMLFVEQLRIFDPGQGFSNPLTAGSVSVNSLFLIISNNMIILLISFIISIVYRAGIFIIAWNASVWGVILGSVASQSGTFLGENATIFFVMAAIIILPHMVLEVLAYVCGVVSGNSIYITMWKKLSNAQYNNIVGKAFSVLIIGQIMIVVAALVEVFFAFPLIGALLLTFY